jgi:hypothetical protein
LQQLTSGEIASDFSREEVPKKYSRNRKPIYGARFAAKSRVCKIANRINQQQADGETITPSFTADQTESSRSTGEGYSAQE